MAEILAAPSSKGLSFPLASPPDIIRANQKDLYYRACLHDQTTTVFKTLLGSRAFMRFQQEFSVLSDLAYFCATTLSGRLTLGEEYCDIIPIHQASGTPPSASRRWTLILLQVASPYLFEKLLVLLRHLKAARGMAAGVGVGALTADHVGLAAVSHLATVSLISLRQFITGQLRSIHLAIFYFVGSYYHFSKRLLGIRYIFNRQRRPGEETVGYELLGVLILLQLFTRWFLDARKRALAQQDLSLSSIASTGEMASEGDTTITTATVDQLQQQQQHPDFIDTEDLPDDETDYPSSMSSSLTLDNNTTNETNNPSSTSTRPSTTINTLHSSSSSRKCTLCLYPRKHATVTPCGHVFCYYCITEWCREKPICPTCRQSVNVSHLILAQNL